MSNGHVCCLFGVCCPPDNDGGRQSKALYEEMEEALGGELLDGVVARGEGSVLERAASWIIANFDLVPKGVGRAIVEGYAPEFEKKHAKNK